MPDLTPKFDNLPYIEPISVHQTRQVVEATGEVKDAIKALIGSSARLEQLTLAIIETSRDSNRQITALNESSTKVEALTVALKNLTLVLIVLGILGLLLPIGIEVWHAKRAIDAPIAPIVVQPPQSPSPPRPPLPSR
jgi:uncharacterized membrane protein YqjE